MPFIPWRLGSVPAGAGRARRAARRPRPAERVLVLAALLATARVAAAEDPAAAAPDPADIMRRNFVVGRVADSRAELTMTLISADGTRRVRETRILTKLLPNGVDQKRLIRFLSPAGVKGTTTLLVEDADGDDDIWIYLPALRKVHRLVTNSKKNSFVGTDFSYGDMIGHKVDDWTYEYLGTETLDGVATHVVMCVPRTDEVRDASGYSKRKVWIRRDNLVSVRGEYWNTGGELMKVFTARDVREIDPTNHKWQASFLGMRNEQTEHATEIAIGKLEVGVGLGDEHFTEQSLEREF